MCLCVCVDVCCKTSNCYFYSFSLISTKLGIHDLFANTQKIVEHILQILILKFWEFFKILNLDLVSGAAGL